jgi:hypothetical protein
VEANKKLKILVKAFVYNLLLHEYLHALGHAQAGEVRSLVYIVSKECFGEDHTITKLAETSPWILLKEFPLENRETFGHSLEIVKDFEKPDRNYII